MAQLVAHTIIPAFDTKAKSRVLQLVLTIRRISSGAIVVLTDATFEASLCRMLSDLDDGTPGGIKLGRRSRRRVTANVIAVTEFDAVDADALLYCRLGHARALILAGSDQSNVVDAWVAQHLHTLQSSFLGSKVQQCPVPL